MSVQALGTAVACPIYKGGSRDHLRSLLCLNWEEWPHFSVSNDLYMINRMPRPWNKLVRRVYLLLPNVTECDINKGVFQSQGNPKRLS
jgi:hypothetical protein